MVGFTFGRIYSFLRPAAKDTKLCGSTSRNLTKHKRNSAARNNYTLEDSHGTCEYTPGKGKSSSKPSFSGSMLIFGGVNQQKNQNMKLSGLGEVHVFFV